MSASEMKDNSVLDELMSMKERMDMLCAKSFRRQKADRSSVCADENWRPPADICENRKEWVMKVDLPGVAESDVHMEIEDYHLTIQGKRSDILPEKDFKVFRSERPRGYFSRTFSLPSDIQTEAVTAEFERGVLTIKVLKNPGPSRKIKVRAE